ncbi:CWF19-like protein 2 [Bombus flavifrons]|uniref:CWF19-like protein 2 n=1 Tax=Bombus flavifrons TaxID=103934 RepID=UPI003704C2B6
MLSSSHTHVGRRAKRISNSDGNNTESGETKPLTESEMNKLGAKIVKAELMGNTKLADELKIQLKNARDIAKNVQICSTEEIQNVILTQTDSKGITRPLESRVQTIKSSQNNKRKNVETHVSGKKVRHYFDDDKYSLENLFHKEKGRSTNEDDAVFVKIASKNGDMDEIFEEQITHIKSDAEQNEKDRSHAIKEHKRLSKSLDNCYWCIDSKYMLKHMIITMDSDICLSLPHYTSLTSGHCIITPVHHIACQLQLDENIWEKLKMFKEALYKMFMDQKLYPVFYEIYKSRHKFSHMQLECVPLKKRIGELAPIYFKKALLECETEWSMNKKVINLENKDVRKAIPNGLSYFMVEFERNKGYAHVIEDEHMFPTNFAQEIIGGMLDLNRDIWRKPKKEHFDQQREKVLKFSEIWKKYESDIKNHN